MPDPSNQTRSQLDQEAARIFLSYRDGDGGARRAALENWARGDSERSAAARRAEQLWLAIETKKRAHTRRRGRRFGAFIAGPPVVLIAILLLPALWHRIASDIYSSDQVVRDLRIDDGVIADLDAGTALLIERTGRDVEISLTTGAIHLSVDPAREGSVRVAADETVAHVTGTRFAVARLSGGVQVSVSEGTVAVVAGPSEGSEETPLRRGQVWRGSGLSGAVSEIDPDKIALWRNNRLTVRNRPLGEVVDVVSRRYTGRIIAAENALLSQRISGSFEISDPIAALEAAAAAADAEILQVSPWLAIVMRN